MATGSKTTSYTSTEYVESAGLVLFSPTPAHDRICILHLQSSNLWVLPKGRRNLNESRQTTALREVFEETGYKAHFVPVNMYSRCPPAIEEPEAKTKDEKRWFEDVRGEPFMFQVREMKVGVKILWWFVGCVEDQERRDGKGEVGVGVEWVHVDEGVERLSFESDRKVVREALGIVRKGLV